MNSAGSLPMRIAMACSELCPLHPHIDRLCACDLELRAGLQYFYLCGHPLVITVGRQGHRPLESGDDKIQQLFLRIESEERKVIDR